MKIRKIKIPKMKYRLRLIGLRELYRPGIGVKTYSESEWNKLMNTKDKFDYLIDKKRKYRRKKVRNNGQ